MENVINPLFIYLLGVIAPIKTLFMVIAVITLIINIALVIAYLTYVYGNSVHLDNFTEQQKSTVKKIRSYIKKIIYIPAIILLFIAILIPSKGTLIAMYVADKITWGDVNKVGELSKNLKNEIKKDIFELIDKLIQKEKNEELEK